MPVLLCELFLLLFHQVFHGVAGRADVGLLLGCQLCLQIHHLLLQVHNLTPLMLNLSRQSFGLGSVILLEPVIHRASICAALTFAHSGVCPDAGSSTSYRAASSACFLARVSVNAF